MRRFSQRHNIGRTIIARRGAAPLSVLALCCIAQHAHAVTFTVDDFQISLETTLSAGVSFRTSGQNPYFRSPANGGTYSGYQGPSDLNWPAGHPFQAPLRGTNDLQIDRDNYTAFFRATYLIDPILSNPNSSNYQPLSHQAVYTVGQNFRLLDGFVRGKYDWFGQSEAVSVGWQTYNWGEGLFLRNGLNAVNPIDAAGIQRNRLRCDQAKWEASHLLRGGLKPSAPLDYGDKLEHSGDPDRPIVVRSLNDFYAQTL